MRNTHIVMSIDGALKLSDEMLDGAIIDDNGKSLSASEARKVLNDYKAKGFKVMPACDHHDERGYCLGHEVEDM